MNKDWDELKLNELRIHELRDLARKIGVRSPTSQKKEDIVSKILEIISGESEPYVVTKAKGRPTRSATQLNNLVDFFLPDEINEDLVNAKSYEETERFDFFAEMPEAEYSKSEVQASVEVEGYLDITASGYGIIRINGFQISEDDVYVNKVYIARYSLHAGDYIVAVAKTLYPNRPKAVTSIISINSDIKNKGMLDFESQKAIKGKPVFDFGGNKINLGENAIIFSDDKLNFEDVKNFAEDLKSKTKATFISVIPSPTIIKFAKEKDYIVSSYDITKGYEDIYTAFNLSYRRAVKLAETKDVVYIVSGLNYYYRALTALLSEKETNSFKLEELVRGEIIRMLAKCKATENGSLTVIVYETIKQNTKILDFIKYDLGNLTKVTAVKNGNKFELI